VSGSYVTIACVSAVHGSAAYIVFSSGKESKSRIASNKVIVTHT